MQIDAHTHILSLAEDAEFTTEYGREGSLCIYRSLGLLPSHRPPTEQEWEASGYSRRGFPVIGPDESVRDHPGFDKIVILAVSPQFLDGELIGTVDTYGITGVPGPPTPEKCNDYIAAIAAARPDTFIGYASVNPAYRGPAAAVRELERAVRRPGPDRPQAVPDVPGLVPRRPGDRVPGVREGGGTRHPGDGAPGRLDPDRRPDGVRPPGAAGRGRAALPGPAAHDRALRAALGGRGHVHADQAPELLRRAELPHRQRDHARSCCGSWCTPRRPSCRWRSCSSAPTTRGSCTTR